MSNTTTAPTGVVSSTELGLLLIGPHDHPEPRSMMWSALELAAIKEYAARCVAAERERICVAIKAADDKSVDEAGYMLDSTDCISIVRGTWPNAEVVRPAGSERTQS